MKRRRTVSEWPVDHMESGGAGIVVVSDLHLAEGVTSDGNYAGRENFYADGAFARCLRDLREATPPPILVLNGDIVDFVRVISIPRTADDFVEWHEMLARIGVARTPEALRASVDPVHEGTFGLATDDFKSVWKLERVVRGHPEFFEAFADWLKAGGRACIVKGNHDLDWHWDATRRHLAAVLTDRFGVPPAALSNLRFFEGAVVVDGRFYIEHGHRFDPFSRVLGDPVLPNGRELNLPFGSFFNRYLLNRIELSFPYFENVRPRENLLPLLLRERFFLGLKLLFYHVPFALRLIPKRYYRYVLGRTLALAAVIAAPAVVGVALIARLVWSAVRSGDAGNVAGSLTWAMVMFALSYFGSRLVSHAQLKEPESLADSARIVFAQYPDCRVVTFGHTHFAEQSGEQGRSFRNTGTWIPVVETSSAQIRTDRTYCVLRVEPASGEMRALPVERWNDDAGRLDPLVLRLPAE